MAKLDTVDSVKVRMYRHGFGDCFLLSFFDGSKRAFTMLIDCGIKYNTRLETVTIDHIIEDLKKTLENKNGTPRLDVLVVTHEHWDHVAFFHPTRGGKKNYFQQFEIGQTWLAWTENPKDKEATTINSRLREGVAALGFAMDKLEETQETEANRNTAFYFGDEVAKSRGEFNQAIDNMVGFYGARSTKEESDSGIRYKKNGRISSMTQEAMQNVIDRFGRETGTVRYFLPGTLVDQDLAKGINIYVLGPPKSHLINKSNPSRGAAKQTYFDIDGFGMKSFVDAALAMGSGGSGSTTAEQSRPFGKLEGISVEQAKRHDYFEKTYFASGEEYRGIENNWLDIAGQFALQLDGAVNNTSLVLAIELAESGKVMLFPGDAQVGSWLSWHEHAWEVPNDPADGSRGNKKVNAEDLLRNTVLYKVSHHGSHNATLKDKGLEMMTHPELVAMIPEKEDSYSGILCDKLTKRLYEVCKGRVIVSADRDHDPKELERAKPDGLTESEWETFKENLDVQDVFVEYTVRD